MTKKSGVCVHFSVSLQMKHNCTVFDVMHVSSTRWCFV